MAQRFAIDKTPIRIAALSTVIFALNLYVCRELFHIEYLRHMGSIEGLFIALARYVSENWNDLTWFPLWYGGVPYANTYPPLLPLLVTVVARLSGWSPALAYHGTVAFLYCAAPVFLFWLCYRLSHSMIFSFAAGTLQSIVSPSAFLIADIRHDLGGLMGPRRLQTLIIYGEGPHMMGLALLPLTILLLDLAIRKRKPALCVLAAFAFAAVTVTNWLATAGLLVATCAYLLAFAERPYWRPVLMAIGIGVLAYAFAAPWIPPSTIQTFQFNSKTIEGDYRQYGRLFPLRFAALIVFLGAAKFTFTKLRASRTLQFGAYIVLVTVPITTLWEYAHVVLVPQPHRYNLESEIGIVVLVAFLGHSLLSVAGLLHRQRLIQVAAGVLCIAAAVPFVKEHRHFARAIIQPLDITQRVEYKSARWIDEHLSKSRVYVPGSIMLWLNAFTDAQQLAGADAQGSTNFLTRVADYVVTSSYMTGDRDVEISLTWLQTYGVAAVEVAGLKSQEIYHAFQKLRKFDGVLKELWRDGDDVIYAIPNRSNSLAHAIRRTDLPSRPPVDGLDIEPLKPYVAALNDAALPSADLRWTSRHSAEIRGELRPEHILAVQVSDHPGWRATSNGRPVRVYGDHAGQLVVEPGCNGPCVVELQNDGGLEMRLAKLACWMALGGSAIWIVWSYLR